MKSGIKLGVISATQLRASVCLVAVSLLLGGFVTFLSGTAGATPRLQTQDVVPEAAEQALFVKGQSLFSHGLYHEAAAVFGDFLNAYPKSPINDLALLWLGRCHIRVGDVGAAEQIAVRLRAVSDTQYTGLLEEELRVARQGFDKARKQPAEVESRSAIGAAVDLPAAANPVPAALSSTDEPLNKTTTTKINSAIPVSVAPSPANDVLNKTTATKAIGPVTLTSSKAPPLAKVQAPGPQTKIGRPIEQPRSIVISAGPLVRIRLEQNSADHAIGGVVFYRLLIINDGKGVAKNLFVSELLPADLEFASSDPAPIRQEIVGGSQRLSFQILELKPGASRALRIAVRLRGAARSDAVLKAKHAVTYQDSGLRNYLAN